MESPGVAEKENKVVKGAFAVAGIMSTLVIYGILQEKIMRVPYGQNKEYFTHSLFLVFCNRLTTSAVSSGALLASKKTLTPVAPVYKYCLVSITNILTTTCQYEAADDISPYKKGRESNVWGVSLMICYLGFDGFTRLVLQGQLLAAVDFVYKHNDCFFDIALLSTVATASQFFISYTIRTFGALTFATIMTTRQLLSILLSCLWFAHPLSPPQLVGAVIVFGTLYAKSFLRSNSQKPPPQDDVQDKESIPLKENP